MPPRCAHCGTVLQASQDGARAGWQCPTCARRYARKRPAALGTEPAPSSAITAEAAGWELPAAPGKSARPASTLGRIGRFELTSVLGRGAFGIVYRAYDPVLERELALKVPRFDEDEGKQ